MTLKLGPDAERIIQEQLSTRKFADAESVILAGLKSLASRAPDEFEAGEMETLLTQGEESIARDGTLDADEALAARRAMRHGPTAGAA